MKATLLTLNLIGLFVYQLFFGVAASVEHEPPTQLAPGESVEVTVTITKSDVAGPAQLRLYLSDGLIAEKVDTKGASFSFDEEHNAVMIWMEIPSDETFDVVYKLTAAEDASGPQTVSGKFSYLENEERMKIEIPESTIEITGVEVVEDTGDTGDETTDEPESFNVVTNRDIRDNGDGTFTVEVAVDLDGGTGFGRIKDQIPAGLTATNNDSWGGSFKFESNAVTYVWTDVAAKGGALIVSYDLVADEGVYGEFIIGGAFTAEFLINEGTSTEIAIPDRSMIILEPVADNTGDDTGDTGDDTGDVADNTGDDTGDTGDTGDDTGDVADTTGDDTSDTSDTGDDTGDVADTTGDDTGDSNDTGDDSGDVADNTGDDTTTFPPVDDTADDTTTNIPAPEDGVTYKVQICAGHKTVSQDYFERRHSYTGTYSVEDHEGWIKYTVGSFADYKDARNERETITAGYDFQGPFVTAYNDGTRITVQEALMISNQKWIK